MYVCVRARACVFPATQDRSCILKNVSPSLENVCCLPGALWLPLGPHLLYTPLSHCTGDMGLPDRSLHPQTVCPLPLSVSSAPSLALRCPPAGHPGLAQERRAGRLPHSLPPTTPVGVASCALGKAECSINFWCSGLLLWGFPLGQGWGCSRHSRCPWVLVIEGCRPKEKASAE